MAILTLGMAAPVVLVNIILIFKSESNILIKSEEYKTRLTHLKKRDI